MIKYSLLLTSSLLCIDKVISFDIKNLGQTYEYQEINQEYLSETERLRKDMKRKVDELIIVKDEIAIEELFERFYKLMKEMKENDARYLLKLRKLTTRAFKMAKKIAQKKYPHYEITIVNASHLLSVSHESVPDITTKVIEKLNKHYYHKGN